MSININDLVFESFSILEATTPAGSGGTTPAGSGGTTPAGSGNIPKNAPFNKVVAGGILGIATMVIPYWVYSSFKNAFKHLHVQKHYNDLIKTHKQLIDKYNTLVKQYNDLDIKHNQTLDSQAKNAEIGHHLKGLIQAVYNQIQEHPLTGMLATGLIGAGVAAHKYMKDKKSNNNFQKNKDIINYQRK